MGSKSNKAIVMCFLIGFPSDLFSSLMDSSWQGIPRLRKDQLGIGVISVPEKEDEGNAFVYANLLHQVASQRSITLDSAVIEIEISSQT